MTAAVTVEGGPIRASRGARVRAFVGAVYVGMLGGVTVSRSMALTYILAEGEAAAAGAVVLSLALIALALLVATLRAARVSVDEDGIRWGWGGVGFRLARKRVRAIRVYDDAVAVGLTRGSVWYLSARDYTPYPELVAGLARARFELSHEGRPAPLAARLQAYGVALDVLLGFTVLGTTLVFLVA